MNCADIKVLNKFYKLGKKYDPYFVNKNIKISKKKSKTRPKQRAYVITWLSDHLLSAWFPSMIVSLFNL